MDKMLGRINSAIWGMPLLTLILGVGFYLTLRLRFVQITAFPKALGYFLRQLLPGRREDDESSFRSLCTALAATVGTGNLVGVAGASLHR